MNIANTQTAFAPINHTLCADCGQCAAAPVAAPKRYDALSRTLHWVFAVAIIYASVAGYSMHIVTNPTLHSFLSQMNMSLATVLIMLFPVRLIWKLLRTEPAPIASIPSKQQKIAHIAHNVLYGLIAWVLITGFVMVPHGYNLFWTIPISTPFEEGPVTHAFNVAHRIGCMTLASMVLLHVAAALKHQFVSRNGVLDRML
ncbi:cytochrome b [Amantichitinum ursilacus]|uniref:Cytochrome b561 bacterial/Ni-hydrogenase domain-containing protein n=1 Tax=Amantichitinum ursilacus TaxID=857265 RepID=A0A0N0XG73_9NEIS|nr:cytochrome b/b6 domain-containing protein [Amantichitinum ursilacus]KPC49796.1 hypothetical protein WG78_19320 [Amantichitinum ursilacus]